MKLLFIQRQDAAVDLGHRRRASRQIGNDGQFAEHIAGLDHPEKLVPHHQADFALQQQVHPRALGKQTPGFLVFRKDRLACRFLFQRTGGAKELQRNSRLIQRTLRGELRRGARNRFRAGRGFGRKIEVFHGFGYFNP